MKLRQWLSVLRILLFRDTTSSVKTYQDSKKTIGKQGEMIALAYLQQLGWRLIKMNLRFGSDELDLLVVSPDEQVMAIVEVRTTSDPHRSPERTITSKKRAAMLRVAKKLQTFAYKHRCTLRVDVIAVSLRQNSPSIAHYEGVFSLPRPKFSLGIWL